MHLHDAVKISNTIMAFWCCCPHRPAVLTVVSAAVIALCSPAAASSVVRLGDYGHLDALSDASGWQPQRRLQAFQVESLNGPISQNCSTAPWRVTAFPPKIFPELLCFHHDRVDLSRRITPVWTSDRLEVQLLLLSLQRLAPLPKPSFRVHYIYRAHSRRMGAVGHVDEVTEHASWHVSEFRRHLLGVYPRNSLAAQIHLSARANYKSAT